MSEEGIELDYAVRKEWEKYWCVDPLDGTREFIKRNGEFTVNVALIENNSPILGVIYIPVKDDLYASADGIACHIQNASNVFHSKNFEFEKFLMNPISHDKVPDPFKVLISRSHLSAETEKYMDKLKRDHERLEFLSAGSALKFGWLAEGKADIYPRFSPMYGMGYGCRSCYSEDCRKKYL